MTFGPASPVFSVRDPDASVEFYCRQLGFDWHQKFGEPTFFAIVARQKCRIMLRFTRDGMGTRPWVPDVDQPLFDAYIGVGDVDAYRSELVGRGLDVAGAEDRAYGMREITVTDPDGYVLIFGQDISPE